MTLHVVALPHTHPDGSFPSCAYTTKVERFCCMMAREGHEVVLYSGDRVGGPNDVVAAGASHVPLFTEEDRQAWYPDGAADRIQQGDYTGLTWETDAEPWRQMNARAVAAILERREPRDVLCLIAGRAQEPIAAGLPELQALEFGIGYEGVFAPYRVYESYAWMHYLYGKTGVADGRWYDDVIPNYFDPAEFHLPEDPGGARGGSYLLFLGRVTPRKGPGVAAQIAKRLGRQLLVAGYGGQTRGNVLLDDGGNDLGLIGQDVEYLGPVGPVQRAELLAGADCLLAPTLYIEPFGGVAVEAMLSGTPAVTSDWGAFTETVEPGLTGARFRTLQEGAAAVEWVIGACDPVRARERAVERFAMVNVAPRYSRLLERLDGLWDGGWGA